MKNLVHLFYVSSATQPFSEQQLKDLLVLSKDANKRHNITGMLLYEDGNFMQVIEGEEADIDRLMLNIQSDPKHAGIILLLKESIQARDFSSWSMGFKDTSSEKKEGFADFLSSTAQGNISPGIAKTLLLSFR